MVYPSFMAGFVNIVTLVTFASILNIPPLLKLLLQVGVLPSPGQGPSEAQMDAGFLRVTGYAKGTNGGEAKAVFYFPTDPGYRDTV